MQQILYQKDILDHFKRTFEGDGAYIKDWIVTWEYQERRKKRKVNYGEGLPEEFYDFKDPSELGEWINWMLNVEKSNFLNGEAFENMAESSKELDFKVFEEIGYQTDEDRYMKGLGIYNAQDFVFANLIPFPEENDGLKVLDFGAGYGRQANLWTKNVKDLVYVGMDAIPKSYCFQHYYYSKTGKLRQEYVLNPTEFNLVNAEPGIHHLPTWRWDLLPDNYFDKILLVQVLQEMNTKLVQEMIKTFHRVLKPGGSLYIRDKESKFRPAHRLNSEKLLEKSGFTLEYKAHVVHKKELHGIPRIWRKTREEVVKSREITFAQRINEWILDVDVLTQGRLKRLIKRSNKN